MLGLKFWPEPWALTTRSPSDLEEGSEWHDLGPGAPYIPTMDWVEPDPQSNSAVPCIIVYQ